MEMAEQIACIKRMEAEQIRKSGEIEKEKYVYINPDSYIGKIISGYEDSLKGIRSDIKFLKSDLHHLLSEIEYKNQENKVMENEIRKKSKEINIFKYALTGITIGLFVYVMLKNEQ